MAECPDLAAAEAEYDKGSGSGPFGMREVSLGCLKNFTLNPVVSIGAAVLLWAFVIKCSADQEQSMADFKAAQTGVTKTFTWLYIMSQDYWLFFMIPLCYYYGHVKLGQDDEKPEYSDSSYFAMVFCAGVAIGLIFYGASEPLWHMSSNRYTSSGYLNDNQKAQAAMNVTLFHWGLQAWVVYALTAVSMGLLSYRKGLPLCFRTTLAPLFGKATWGWFGDLIDVITIVTIVAGLCTSLGLGAKQIVGGLQRLEILGGDLDEDGITNAASATIAIITCVATCSVVAGLDYGIKTLSQVAFLLGNFLLCTVFFLDKPWYILNVMVQSLGYHLQHFLEISFACDAFAQLDKGEGAPMDGKGANPSWMDWWTIFYWGWWIAWAPFVGTFLARISRGRTIQNVLAYTLCVPSSYALVWFCTFGSAAIRMDRNAAYMAHAGTTLHGDAAYFVVDNSLYRPSGAGPCYSVPAEINATALGISAFGGDPNLSPVCAFSGGDDAGYWFDLMGQYHGFGPFLCVVSVITTTLYFVTSSDSGSLVVDLIAANGREAHVTQRVFWAVTEGAVAIALLQSGGSQSLKALQAVSIVAGLPFTVILMFMTTALWRALKIEEGHMLPRTARAEWKMPLYAGIFDILETALTLGKSPMPEGSYVRDFFLGLFAPPVVFLQALGGFAGKQGTKIAAQDYLMVVGLGLAYLGFVFLHILEVAKTGLFGFGWTALVAFAAILGSSRNTLRTAYGIQGSGFEDFFSALFLWPQVLAQMAAQVQEEIPVESRNKTEEPAAPKVTEAAPALSI